MAVRRELRARNTKRLLILFDPASGDPCTPIPEQLKQRGCPVPVRYEDLAPAQQPFCVAVDDDEAQEHFVNQTLSDALQQQQQGKPRTVCAWIVPAPQLLQPQATDFELRFARGLASCTVMQDERGARRFVRWFDPRVTSQMAHWLRPEQWQGLLGPVMAWMFVDLDGRLQTLSPPKPQATWALPPLDPGQWARLRRCGVVSLLHPLLREWGVPPAADPAQQLAQVNDLLARAQSKGLHSEADHLVFASCAFNIHERFDEHPHFAALIADAQRGGTPFAEAASAIDEPTLEQIAGGGWLSTQSALDARNVPSAPDAQHASKESNP